MTRDEAMGIIKANYRKLRLPLTDDDLNEISASDIDIYQQLGILKLDEPKPAGEKAFDIICRDVGDIHADIILDKLRAAGLQIVAK